MRIVLDTNVLMSGIFFGDIPGRLLIAWRAKRIQFVVSEEIVDEYRQVATRLTERYSEIDISNIVDLLAQHSERIAASPLSEPVSIDPDDDKFSPVPLPAKSIALSAATAIC